jgi:hypothetical protein
MLIYFGTGCWRGLISDNVPSRGVFLPRTVVSIKVLTCNLHKALDVVRRPFLGLPEMNNVCPGGEWPRHASTSGNGNR